MNRLLVFAIVTSEVVSAQTTERVSVATGGAQANGGSSFTAISATGRYVAFHSIASNLVPGDANGWTDVFVRDRQLAVTERVSVSTSGAEANLGADAPSISADGRYVAFESTSSNLVVGDTNGRPDVFVRDRRLGTTERVSVSTGGIEGDANSDFPSISAGGRYVAFESSSTNLVPGDTNGSLDVFVHDRLTGTTERMSVSTGGVEGNSDSTFASISPDGRYVVFQSFASNLVPGDTNLRTDVFLRDRQTGTTQRMSVGTGGTEGNYGGFYPSISGDGHLVVFASAATNLVPGDTNGWTDIFAHDRLTGTTERLSVSTAGAQADDDCYYSSVSVDGRKVAFWTAASTLVPGDTNHARDVFIRDRVKGTTERASVGAGGAEGNGGGDFSSMSVDGRFVAFASYSDNLVPADTNGTSDVFVRDLGPAGPYAYCFGDGSGEICPCLNFGAAGHGCQNSSATGGAILAASGNPSLSSDSLVLTASGELSNVLSILAQGTEAVYPQTFGDGLGCLGGVMTRLFVKTAVGGTVTAPGPVDPTLSARSSALGDPIPFGGTRTYQMVYRDPNANFCGPPSGSTFNASNAIAISWGQ